MVKNVYRGISYLFQGFGLIVKPGIRRYFFIPLMINLIVFALLTWLGIRYFSDLLNWLLPAGEEWWAVLSRATLWLVFAASALLIMFFTFSMVANLIGAPFNALLAEKVEELLTGIKVQKATGERESFFFEIPSLILNELRKIIYYVIFSILIIVLSLVPVANIVFPFIWLVFTSWILSLEYLGYPMENHGMKFSEVRKEAGKQLMMSLGFGLAVMTSTMIPLVNFVIMPAAVAGATVMWTHRQGGGSNKQKHCGGF